MGNHHFAIGCPTSVTAAMLFLLLNDILTVKTDENNFKSWTFVKTRSPVIHQLLSLLPPEIPFLHHPARASKAERLQCFIQSVMCYCCRLGVRQASGGVLSERCHS